MIDLPKFLRDYRRDCREVAHGPVTLPPGADDLYAEFWSHDGDADYAASPRGKWVLFQLQWIEARREWANW